MAPLTAWERICELEASECLDLAMRVLAMGYRDVTVTPCGHFINVAFRDSDDSRRRSMCFRTADRAIEGLGLRVTGG